MNIHALAKTIGTAASIAPFIQSLRRLPTPTPKEIVDLVLTSPIVRTYQVRSELLEFAEAVAALKPRFVLEIGTCFGGTLCVLTRLAAPDATIISVDLPGGAFGGGYGPIRESVFRLFPSNGQVLHLIKADSHSFNTVARVESLLCGESLDLLFIDGDHTYEGVKTDFEMYKPLVQPGGLIAFHDIVEHRADTGCDVARFWNEIKTPKDIELIEDRNQGWAGIGILTATYNGHRRQ